jgi:HEAT repeat protein
MQYQEMTRSALAAAAALPAAATAVAGDEPALDRAFSKLKTFDWGADYKPLKPIDDRVTATHGDPAAREELETRLAAVLSTGISRAAKDFVCRKLRVVGTAASVPALAALLPDKDLSHLGRYALERIPAAEAAQSLRDALTNLEGKLKIGVIGSLGVRRDEPSVPALARLVGDSDTAIATAAVRALGDIGTAAAASALAHAAKTAAEAVRPAVADARLASAERLLADGKKAEAAAVYKSLAGKDQPKPVRLAATRGLLVVAGKRD